MHALPAALLGLFLAATPALAAKPGERSPGAQRAKATAPAAAAPSAAADRTAAGRQVPSALSRPAGAAAPRPTAAATRTQAGRAATPIRGRMVVSSTRSAAIALEAGCSGRGGARSCRAPRMNWTEGLSPAAGVQAAECPAGTMATLATGHSDVTRCMPI
jgi:hypothetical protein